MNRLLVSIALAAATAATAGAQDTAGPVTSGHGSVYLQPYVGYMAYGNLTESPELSLKNAPIYGAQLGYSFSPNFSIVGNVGYSPTNFEFERRGTSNDVRASGDIDLLVYDANLQFRLPFVANSVGSTIAPFAQLGVGAMKFSPDDNEGLEDLEDGPTNVAFNAGLGIDIQIRKSIGLRLMAKDYVTSLAFDDFGTATDVIIDDAQGQRENKISNNVALTVGLNFGF